MKRQKKENIYENAKPVFFAVLFVLVIFIAWNYLFETDQTVETAECEFHFIDVGQGDCTLIKTEDAAVLIDAGPGDVKDETVSYLKDNVKQIDYFVITHPDEDHIGGASEIISRMKVCNVLMTDASKGTATFTKLLDAIEESNVRLIRPDTGDSFTEGGIRIDIIRPVDEFDGDYNDYSIVTRVSYGDISAIITGDAEHNAENNMMKRYCDSDTGKNGLKADILKLGHHGSSTSSSKEFVKMVAPQYAVISCGKDNAYGHPHKETLRLLDDLSIECYRTDKSGTIVFETDGEAVQYRSN